MHFSTIVDAGNSPAHAHILFAAMAAAGLPPVRYLVLTHWDWAALRAGASTSAADSIVVHIPEERITFLSDCRYEDLYVELTAEAVRLRLVGGNRYTHGCRPGGGAGRARTGAWPAAG